MGKTAVFVLASLQLLEEEKSKYEEGEKKGKNKLSVVVICHARELAYQIKREYDRFAKYFQWAKVGVVYGGIPITKDREWLKKPDECPHVLIGTPGRILALVKEGSIDMQHV